MNRDAELVQEYSIAGMDFVRAGVASCAVKDTLKEIGLPQDIIRRVAVAAYEAEMNVVMYARNGTLRCEISPSAICITLQDEGPGIEDIDLSMQEGFSTATHEMREMGFGAGMGLPNIKRNSDSFRIFSEVDKGTRLEIFFYL